MTLEQKVMFERWSRCDIRILLVFFKGITTARRQARTHTYVGLSRTGSQCCIIIDADPGSKKCSYGSGSYGVKTKEEKIHQKIVN